MNSPRSIRIGQTLLLADGEYTVVDHMSGIFRLRSELTGEYRLIGLAELTRLLPPGKSPESEPAKRRELTVTESLAGLDEQTRMLIPHLEELLTGRPAVGTEPRSQYADSVLFSERLHEKLKELRSIGIDIAIATLKRRFYRYRDLGAAGLVDRRKTKVEIPLARIDKRVKPILVEILAEYEKKSTPTVSAIRAQLRRRLMERFPDNEKRPSTPSKSSVERYIKLLDGDRKTTGSATQRRSKANSPDHPHTSRLASAPGDEVQIDATQLDAFVRMPDGQSSRPWLVILVDKYTKTLLGHNLTQNRPVAADHAVLLARCLVPPALRPWSRRYQAHGLPEMPWAEYLDEAQKEKYDAHRPYIFPRRIITDNGKDFTSELLRSSCARYGIHLTESPIVDPTSKAQVERMFGTIRTKFTQYLPGYTGGRLEFRGSEPRDDPLLDLRTVNDLFEEWTGVIWQNRLHDGLLDPYIPSVRHTPNTMYAASLDLSGHFYIPLEAEEYIALMPKERRVVSAQGIEFRGRRYDSPDLRPMRDQRDDQGKKVLHDVYFDPSDIHQVWVRSTITGSWITCEWTEIDGLARPHRAATMARAHQLSLENRGLADDEADDMMLDMVADAVAESEARAAAEVEDVMSDVFDGPEVVEPKYRVQSDARDDDPDAFTALEPL